MLPNMQRLQIMNPDFVTYNSVTKALTNLKILQQKWVCQTEEVNFDSQPIHAPSPLYQFLLELNGHCLSPSHYLCIVGMGGDKTN